MLTIKFYHEDRELLTLIMVSGVIFDPTVLKHVIFFNRSELLGNHQGQINGLDNSALDILSHDALGSNSTPQDRLLDFSVRS